MFGMGLPEIILIVGIAFIVISPKNIPDHVKALRRALGAFKRATSDIKKSMHIDKLNESLDEFSGDLKDVLKEDFLKDDNENIKKESYVDKKKQENTKKKSEKINGSEGKQDE